MLRPTFVILGMLTLFTGLAWPLAITGVARVAFTARPADGAVGQDFHGAEYFHSRPSALTTAYDARNSGGSNLGPTNPVWLDAVKARVEQVRAENPEESGPVPADLVTASASGLDPHLSVAGARFQAKRVAKARGMDVERVLQLIDSLTEPRWLGVFGEERVNVVRLNRALSAPRAP